MLLQFHRPVRTIEERFPRLVLLLSQLLAEQRGTLGLFRLADQLDVGLLGRAATLLDVAVQAGADDVLPRCSATLTAGYHVIQRQV